MIQDAPAKTGAFFLGVLTDWTAVDKTGEGGVASPLKSWRKMAVKPARIGNKA
jgi:hypothetical protein